MITAILGKKKLELLAVLQVMRIVADKQKGSETALTNLQLGFISTFLVFLCSTNSQDFDLRRPKHTSDTSDSGLVLGKTMA